MRGGALCRARHGACTARITACSQSLTSHEGKCPREREVAQRRRVDGRRQVRTDRTHLCAWVGGASTPPRRERLCGRSSSVARGWFSLFPFYFVLRRTSYISTTDKLVFLGVRDTHIHSYSRFLLPRRCVPPLRQAAGATGTRPLPPRPSDLPAATS